MNDMAMKMFAKLKLTRSYILALGLIAMFMISSAVIREVHHIRHLALVDTLEHANREVRLTQRMAIIARLMMSIEPSMRGDAYGEFVHSLRILKSDMVESPNPRIPAGVRQYLQDYLLQAESMVAKPYTALTSADPNYQQLMQMVSAESFAKIEALVEQFVHSTEDSLGWLMDMERFLLTITLLLLLVEGLTIFRPMVRAVHQAQDYLLHLNRMKSEFLANMSHEIRTPINAVFGIGELLLQSNMTTKQRSQVETLMASADGLLSVIDDILDFSKIEAGRLEVESVAFDLHSAIDDVAELLAIRAREKRLEVIVRYMPGTPQFVMGDAGRIRQILMNLIGNAIKFTESGYVMITAETMPNSEGDDTPKLRVAVEDTGIGIPLSKQQSIFDIFAQADGSTTRKYGGTGLGLTITRQLVELMGGEIHVDSEEGKGSSFWFTLNMAKADRPSKFEPSRTVLVGKRVLVVDDIQANREVLMDNLAQSGMQVVCAESGKEALRAMRRALEERRPFDMLLTDYLMPEMNGDMLVRTIRNDATISNIPVIVLSSIEERGFIKIFSAMKVAAYLSKPVRREQLLDMMSMVLDAQARGQPFDMLTTHATHALRAHTSGPAQLLSGTRILLTEDNRVNLEFTTEMLVGMGCLVDHAENGKVAVEKVRKQPFDIILMDCQMPVMDGFEAAQHIHAMQQRGEVKRMPIIALTANAMDGDRERCLKSGMQDYLSKPVRRANLESMLLRWVQNTDAAEAVRSVPMPMDSREAFPVASGIDREAWNETRTLVGEKINLISGYFIEDGERYISEIEAAARSGADPKSFVMPAHTLKSSSRQFGLLGLSDLARRIEEIGRTQADMQAAIAGVQPLLAPLRLAFEEATSYLQLQRNAS